MSNDIPSGYQLHIVSWENDADHYKTQTLYGLTQPDVEFLLSIAKQFTSHSNRRDPGPGNVENDPEFLIKLVNDALTAHPNISADMRLRLADWPADLIVDELDEYDDLGHVALELIEQLLGSPVEYDDEFFCRVFESYTVYYSDAPIEDVTFKF